MLLLKKFPIKEKNLNNLLNEKKNGAEALEK